MPTTFDLTKSFQVSKMNVYVGGSPLPYVASVKIPPITSPTETFNNTSTGGEIKVANPHRRNSSGDGEVKFENADLQLESKIMDVGQLYSMQLALAVNALNPQLGQFLALPMKYTIGAQFFEVDPGEIANSGKREITAKFNMLSYKVDINGVTVVDFNFVSGTYITNQADLVALATLVI